jgi:hypothetical protein
MPTLFAACFFDGQSMFTLCCVRRCRSHTNTALLDACCITGQNMPTVAVYDAVDLTSEPFTHALAQLNDLIPNISKFGLGNREIPGMPDIVDKTLAAIDLAELFIRKVQESLGCCINSCWDLLDNAWDCAFMHACMHASCSARCCCLTQYLHSALTTVVGCPRPLFHSLADNAWDCASMHACTPLSESCRHCKFYALHRRQLPTYY